MKRRSTSPSDPTTASSREAIESCLARLHAVNPAINAVVRVLEDDALAAADAADAARARGDALGPLHGVPVTVKVNTDQAGYPTDNGVVAYRDNVATADNPVVANLKRAGAVIIGRTNTPAFSMRIFADNVNWLRFGLPAREDDWRRLQIAMAGFRHSG